MRNPAWILLLLSAGCAGTAAAQALNFSATQISTPANFEGYTQGVAVGDFNGDGKPDLALSTNGGPDHPQIIVVLLGNGDGTFQKGVVYPPAGRTPQTVVVADFNGDGKQDLAVPEFSGGLGVPGDISLFFGNGDGTFQPAVRVPVGDQAGWLAVGHFNNDANLDLAVPNPNSNRIEVLLGNGDGTFQAPVIYPVGKGPNWVVAADFNGDGKVDLVTANYGTSDVTVLLGNGDGSFKAAASFPVGSSAFAGIAGDLNGDGKLDLAIACGSSGNLSVLLGNGDGTFQPPRLYAVGKSPNSVVMADFDGDGKIDLAVSDSQATTEAQGLAVLRGNGDGTFQPPVYFDVKSPYGIAVGDLNKDGKPDLAVTNALRDGTVDVSVLINATSATSTLTNVSAASYASGPVAPETIIAAFGNHLANGTKAATTTPLPTDLEGTTVQVKDASGVVQSCQEYFVSPGQVNYYLPKGTATGTATVTIKAGDGTVSTGTMQVAAVAPGVFALNASGLAAALVLRVKPGNIQTVEQVYQLDAAKNVIPLPIDLGPQTDQVYLLLFGTGIRHVSSTANVSVMLGTAGFPGRASTGVPVLFAGAQGTFVGEDQVNAGPVPRSLIGAGSVNLVLTTDQIKANTVNLTFK